MMRKRKTDTTYDYYKEIEKDIKGDQFSPSSCDERLKQTKTNTCIKINSLILSF